MERALVVIPAYKPDLDELDELSLSRCVTVLGRYPLCFVGPPSLSYDHYCRLAPSASRHTFDEACFDSVRAYNRLLLSKTFYEAFAEYDCILIHQLDAFVFKDALEDWCGRGYDYVGAPWLSERGEWLEVGNGGFSLRRVHSCLAVLSSTHREKAEDYWAMVRLTTHDRLGQALRWHRKVKRYLGMGDSVTTFLRQFVERDRPEDVFWGVHAARFHNQFRVPPVETALEFAIEHGLAKAYSKYAFSPPFGCHMRHFLHHIRRYLSGTTPPESEYESLVWGLARKAGLSPTP